MKLNSQSILMMNDKIKKSITKKESKKTRVICVERAKLVTRIMKLRLTYSKRPWNLTIAMNSKIPCSFSLFTSKVFRTFFNLKSYVFSLI